MKKLLSLSLFVGIAFSTWQCKKDVTPAPSTPVTPTPTATAIRVSFENKVGASPLVLGPPYQYQTANGDSFYVSTYKYYISNVSFTNANNVTWSENESYHLINAADANSLLFSIDSIPTANYTSMTFMIGVDSARNTSGAQTGALDPANDMFWTWNTGYIMAKLEGKSPQSNASADNISFHIAGYTGQYATQRWVTITFGSATANVSTSATPQVNLSCNVLEWFTSPTTINFATTHSVAMTGQAAVNFANNYSDMFSLTGIDN